MDIVPPTGIIRKYYEEAVEDIEYRSSAFWQVWLQRQFAKDFRELDLYAVTSESSPDGSRRRVDQVVRRYDPHHHTLSALVWNECKRPSGSAKEAEQQALDAAKRCIQRENLLWIYALTTVGVTFRVWKVWKRNLRLMPLDPDVDEYIDADSAYSWILREAIQQMKDEIPLGDAGVVPSQSHLLGGHDAEEGQSSMQGTQKWSVPPSMPGYAEGEQQEISPAMPLPSTFMAAGGFGKQPMPPPMPVEDFDQQEHGQSSMQETFYGDEAGGSTAIANPSAQSVETWLKVDLYRRGHVTRRDEYVFITDRNHEKSTDRDEWVETKHKGKQAWCYRHRGIYYYTREKPGG